MATLPHNLSAPASTSLAPEIFPQGSPRHGYEFVAPLKADGHIDEARWKTDRAHCRVRRFREGQDDEIGYRLASHVFLPSEYVSIRGGDGEMYTYQVVSVEPAARDLT